MIAEGKRNMEAYMRSSGPAVGEDAALGMVVVAGKATACVGLVRYLGQNRSELGHRGGEAGEKNTRMVGLLSR